ncbi:MAG: patatin-like phospholipase family protein [Bryobacterales bacterium]|nr:patatin-like phospholipase family protein [Bryobacterales bacterium]
MLPRRKTALVLSAGGMFGAYQAGAWEAIAASGLVVDMVIGASIGAVNGWAIAGGCSPAELAGRWRQVQNASRLHWQLPWPPLRGALHAGEFERSIREVFEAFRPALAFSAVLTDLRRMKPVLFGGGELTWRHLAASCAVPGLLPSYKIGGRCYMDGGLLTALPVWAAERMGAERIIAVNAWTPSRWMRLLLKGVKLRSRIVPRLSAGIELVRIRPAGQLGSMRDTLVWKRENVERWMEMGRRDASGALAGWMNGAQAG